jgi:ankyrin repeat protein
MLTDARKTSKSSDSRKSSNRKISGTDRKSSDRSKDEKRETGAVDDDVARSDSDSDLGRRERRSSFDSILSEESDYDEEEETWRKILLKTVVDYGPPYRKPPDDIAPYSIVIECSDYNCNLWNLHKLLNKRLDPNERDPEDLQYTAMHWCVRNCHFSALKMLKLAGAKLNLLNELGYIIDSHFQLKMLIN